MSLLEELFGADEEEEAEALERVIEGGSDDDEPRRGEDEAEEDKRTVDPGKPKSVRVVRNPRVVLNPARLTGPRGIQTLPEHFKDFKFKGKGHEKEDIDLVLKKLEHWAHRLYPKFPFDDCLKKIESLGNKRPVKVTLHKIRSDQLISDEIITQKDSSDDEDPAAAPEDDEFDKLLQQQIELAREAQQTAANTPRPSPHSAARIPALAPKATSSPSISEEQKMRMLRNRQLAEERRLQKLKTSVVDLTDFNPAAQLVATNLNGKHNGPNGNISDNWDPKSMDKSKDNIDISKDPKDINNTNNFIDITNSADPSDVIDISNNVADHNVIDLSNDPSDCFNKTNNSSHGSKSVVPKEIIDMTENSNEASKDSDHMETIDITMIDTDNHGFINKSNVDNENKNLRSKENITHDVDIENACDVQMQDAQTNENQNKTNDSSLNGSKEPMSLHYSDSSDDECEVTTFNISVMADVHKVVASHDTVTETQETNTDNWNTMENNQLDGNNLNVIDVTNDLGVIQGNENDKKMNENEDMNKTKEVEVDNMDFEGNDDDWASIDI